MFFVCRTKRWILECEGIQVLLGTAGSQQMFGHPARISVPSEVCRASGEDILIDPTLAGGMLYPVWHWKAWRSPRWSWKVLLWRSSASGTSCCDRDLTHSNLMELPFSINWIYSISYISFLATTFFFFFFFQSTKEAQISLSVALDNEVSKSLLEHPTISEFQQRESSGAKRSRDELIDGCMLWEFQ